MNLVDLALTTFTESKAMEADEAGDRLERERVEYVERARKCAIGTLSADAGELDWQYVPSLGLPESVEEARAVLAPGRLEYLRYRTDYTDEDAGSVAFELVQPCLACGHDQVTAVSGLFHLGKILSESQDQHANEPEAHGVAQGPLAAVDSLHARAARVTRLARRLLTEHADAGLMVRYAAVLSHSDSSSRAELQVRAVSVEAAASVAKALGAELATKVTCTVPAYVFRHGDVTVAVDGIDVQLSAHTQLSEAEAAAWHAEQAQASEDGEG